MVGYNPLVSIIIVTFNSERYIKGCLKAVFETDYPSFEVVVVDNGSTDGTLKIVEERLPKVKIIKSKKNLGYAGGNNLGAKKTTGRYLAFLNPDTRVTQDWLKPLVQLIKLPNIAACQPKIMLSQQKNLINLTGKTTHFLGFDWLTDYQMEDYPLSKKEITSFSGSAVLIKKEIFQKLSGFDEDFFMYYDDGDLSWRMRLAGYKILLVPDSVVYHEYKYQPKEEYQKAKQKFYYLERNRLVTLIKNYSLKTFILLCPAIKFMEKGMGFYFLSRGWWLEKVRGYFWIIKNLPKILKKRRKIQNMRVLSDKEITRDFVDRIEFREFDNFLLRNIGNPFLGFYWRIVKRII